MLTIEARSISELGDAARPDLTTPMLFANVALGLGGKLSRPARRPKLERGELQRRVAEAIASGWYRILPHARRRCTERDVSAADIECALESGHPVPRRDRFGQGAGDWSYCFEGQTVDRESLRVVVAFDGWMLVVTVVRLNQREG